MDPIHHMPRSDESSPSGCPLTQILITARLYPDYHYGPWTLASVSMVILHSDRASNFITFLESFIMHAYAHSLCHTLNLYYVHAKVISLNANHGMLSIHIISSNSQENIQCYMNPNMPSE